MVEQDTTVYENHFALNEVGRCQAASTDLEQRHSPRKTLGRPPSTVPRIARHHGCRMPVEDPPDTQSTFNEREAIQLIKLLPHTNPNTPCKHSASFENSSTGINRYFQIVINRKVVASYSRDKHIHFATGTVILSQKELWDQQRPSKVPRVTRRHG